MIAYLYGGHVGEGSLTQYIANAFHEDVKKYVLVCGISDYSIILDGEMLVWDPILEKYLAFGTLKTAAGGMAVRDIANNRSCRG